MDNSKMVAVRSASDMTLVINVPQIQLRRAWNKRGASYLIDRELLVQAYYDPSVEYLFKHGLLVTDDKEFLMSVGLISSEDETLAVTILDEKMMARMIKAMPLAELKQEIIKLSKEQREELVEYAISNYKNLSMDRIDLLNKISGKNVLTAISNLKAEEE